MTVTITDLGPSLLMSTWTDNQLYQFVPPSGHFMTTFPFWTGYLSDHLNLFTLDHDTGLLANDGVAVRGPIGRLYAWIYHPVDHVWYLGVYYNSDNSSDLGIYNPVTGVYTKLHDGPEYAYSDGGPAYDGPSNGGMQWSDEPNKRVFYAGGQRGGLWAWDPVVAVEHPELAFHDYGALDYPGGTWSRRYIDSFQVDDTYAYCAMQTQPSSIYYLIKVTLSDGTQTPIWKGDGCSLVQAVRGWFTNPDVIYIKKILGGSTTWYATDDFVNPISAPPDYLGGHVADYVDYTGYTCDFTLSYPDGAGGYTFPVSYTKAGVTQDPVTCTLLDIAPLSAAAGAIASDGKLLLLGLGYSPMVKVNMTTNDIERFQFIPGASLYNIGEDVSRNTEWYVGYSQQSFKQDLTQEWNPIRVSLPRSYDYPGWDLPENAYYQNRKYYYSAYKAADGNIWFATTWFGSVYETQVVWYDPDGPSAGDVGWDDLNPYFMEGWEFNQAGTLLLISQIVSPTEPYDSRIAVIDILNKSISGYLRPIEDLPSLGKIVSVEASVPNHFVGITRTIGETYQTYCFNILTGELLWGPNNNTGSVQLGTGAVISNLRFAHGYVWYYVSSGGNWMKKLDPTTGNITNGLTAADFTAVGCNLYPGQMCWNGYALYHWDGDAAADGKHIYRIDGLVSGYTRGSYVSLPPDDADLTYAYTADDITDVALDDGVRVAQSVNVGGYAIHEFKNDAGSYDSVTLHWDGQTSVAPSESIVKLQIYNRNTELWVDVATNNSANANEDFTLTGNVPDLTDYKDVNNTISCRVWQQAV